jgi:hypothetical protein
MSKTFRAYINENKIGFCIQSYENNIALGIPVCFPSKGSAKNENREILYKEIERIKEYVLTNDEKQQIDEQINSLNLNLILV